MYIYIYIYISRLFRKLIYIAAYIFIFYGGKNVYPMPQINNIALRRGNIDIDVTSTIIEL